MQLNCVIVFGAHLDSFEIQAFLADATSHAWRHSYWMAEMAADYSICHTKGPACRFFTFRFATALRANLHFVEGEQDTLYRYNLRLFRKKQLTPSHE
ncbi:hypothetical protein PSEUDO8Z_60912 [Pseudomonas sp. 8Z]|nr:hypothetical protein PSEUDO8Z_60912 [Pseudomonas sp. 8Z]